MRLGDPLLVRVGSRMQLTPRACLTLALSVEWGRDLLKTGKTTMSGQQLDLGTGSWSNSKYIR